MKQLIKVLILVLLSATTAVAQLQRRPMERIHAAKIDYITDRIRLTREQSNIFIPLYTDYEREVTETRQAFFRKYKGANSSNTDDATARQFIDDNLDYQQQIIELKRKYNDRFLKVISPRQLADLSIAEREFKQILMKRLDRRNNGGRYRSNY